jgi:hypothetical protein
MFDRMTRRHNAAAAAADVGEATTQHMLCALCVMHNKVVVRTKLGQAHSLVTRMLTSALTKPCHVCALLPLLLLVVFLAVRNAKCLQPVSAFTFGYSIVGESWMTHATDLIDCALRLRSCIHSLQCA